MNPCSASTDKAHEQVQLEATVVNQPEVVMDPSHQDAPTQDLLSLKRELQELASQNVSLREQMATKEQEWNEEKRKILKALDGQKAKRLLKCERKETKIKECEEKICLLQDSLHGQKKPADQVTAPQKERDDNTTEAWKNQIRELKVGFNKTLTAVRAEAEERRLVREKEVAAQLKALKDQRNRPFVVNEELLIKLSVERIALETQCSERSARLRTLEEQMVHSEADWKTKVAALEGQLSQKDAETKRGLEREQQLQADWFKKEEEWLTRLSETEEEKTKCCETAAKKEEEWLAKVNEMEEELKLLENHNTRVQELAQLTEKEKRKVKKEEKRAKKDAEKRLQKEKKEMEEREKKEKRENEKQEKERLKREKKEEEEKEKREKKEEEEKAKREKKEEEEKAKREKKEEEEKAKREKKEKKENEKQEKERLKREKKEEEKKEKREKKEKEARDKEEKKEKKEKRRTV